MGKITLKRAALCGKNLTIIIPGAVTYFSTTKLSKGINQVGVLNYYYQTNLSQDHDELLVSINCV